MNMPDINIIKNLSLKFQKAFDRGEIDKLYTKMYETAESIAVQETKLYMQKLLLKWQEELGLSDKDGETPQSEVRKMLDFRNSRIQFHLDQMYKLLELYAKSKSGNLQA